MRSGFAEKEASKAKRLPLIPLFVLLLVGCGAPGAPQPPSLGIPKPVNDLKVLRKGDAANLSWTAPTNTTDGELVRRSGKIVILRGLSDGATPQWQTISQMPFPPALKNDQASAQELKDEIGPLLSSGADFALYSIVAESNLGRNAGASNQVSVPLVPTLATPVQVNAVPVPAGISISWNQNWPPQNQSHLGVHYVYRILRREEGAKTDVVVKEAEVSNEAMALIDTGIEWQKTYQYWIVPVTYWQSATKKGEVQGEPSQAASVFANDIFPPAVPSGLEAVFSGAAAQPAIDLSWTPDTESDLAGYNIYRHRENELPVKINSELVKTSSYRDSSVSAGNKYFYSVSAVDLRGNESSKSADASESVPQP